MRVVVGIALTVAAAFALDACGSLATPHLRFDPVSDAAQTETCFATYMTLSEVAAVLKPQSKSDALEVEAGRGVRRMHSIVDAAAAAVGEKTFYKSSAASRSADVFSFYTHPDNEFRSTLARHLADDAKKCDLLLDAWDVPMSSVAHAE